MAFLDTIYKVLWVGLGGFLGANARYWISIWVQQRWGGSFPWGTFIINVSGCFILGLFMTLFAERFEFEHAPALRLAVAVGFIGAYTTFSTFEYETASLVQTNADFLALANVIGSVVVGFIAVWIGMLVGRAI
jgi:CrcB protein